MGIKITTLCSLSAKNKKGTRIKIQPRFKIQYPMKNHTTNANGQFKLQQKA